MNILQKLFFEGIWECYYRKTDNSSILMETNRRDDWHRLKVSRRYWCADPFIVENEGVSYVFCEMLDRKISRGLLGLGVLNPKGGTEIRVLDDFGCHASYPDVFHVSGQWYMIPETVDRHTIELYRALSFPYKWEKTGSLCERVNAVDTTAFEYEGSIYLFIYEQNQSENVLSIAKMNVQSCTLDNKQVVFAYKEKIGRPGGKVLHIGSKMCRPTQYGINRYGESLVFKDFRFHMNENFYEEKDVLHIKASDVLPKHISRVAEGMHTYNQSGGYEIIDIFRRKFFLERPIVTLLKKLKIGGYTFYAR